MHSKRQTSVKYYVGIDVGSASVRAALVDEFGTVATHAEQPIQIWEPQPDHYEQSSADIWAACCAVTKKVASGVDASQIRGVGFDATCSLVVVDKQFQPLAVNSEGQDNRNVIMWMDHRAVSQVDRINATQHRILSYVGGAMSVEMQPPKLLWIKENLQESCWEKAGHFFDLPDFLSWKATGVTARSLCTLVCKWTYTSDGGWDDSFWKIIGLEDLVKDKYEKIGNHVLSPGESVGKGLTPEAAEELGLPKGIAVAASLIDAHAGGLGVIGADVRGHNLPCENQPITSRVALICGTSSCHMGVSETPIFVPGVWGPYFSAMVPGLWLNEGGQSATGKLIEHVVQGHVAFPELQSKAAASAQSIYTYLNSHLDLIKKSLPVGFLTVDLHVWPDFHGNRSPLTDLTLKGMVVGLTLSRGLDELALIYLATIQAIALGTRHILEAMEAAGHRINTLFLCGGLSKNPLFVQMHADITGKPVVLSKEVESVLVGAAILGACASGDFASIQEAMAKMGKIGRVVRPNHEHKSIYDPWFLMITWTLNSSARVKVILYSKEAHYPADLCPWPQLALASRCHSQRKRCDELLGRCRQAVTMQAALQRPPARQSTAALAVPSPGPGRSWAEGRGHPLAARPGLGTGSVGSPGRTENQRWLRGNQARSSNWESLVGWKLLWQCAGLRSESNLLLESELL